MAKPDCPSAVTNQKRLGHLAPQSPHDGHGNRTLVQRPSCIAVAFLLSSSTAQKPTSCRQPLPIDEPPCNVMQECTLTQQPRDVSTTPSNRIRPLPISSERLPFLTAAVPAGSGQSSCSLCLCDHYPFAALVRPKLFTATLLCHPFQSDLQKSVSPSDHNAVVSRMIHHSYRSRCILERFSLVVKIFPFTHTFSLPVVSPSLLPEIPFVQNESLSTVSYNSSNAQMPALR